MKTDILFTFKKHIESICSLSDTSWNELINIITFRTLKKDEFIVRENQLYGNEVFIHTGIIRGFYCSETGNVYNVVFYRNGEIVIPCSNRSKNGKSNINLQVLSDSEIIEMDQEAFKKLRFKYHDIYVYGNLVQEKELNRKTEREIAMLVKSAEERYIIFRKEYPNIENSISQYHVASYLGITPVSLSRLRKNLISK